MKKAVLISFLLALAATGVFAQNFTVVVDIRRELHAYIDAIPQETLYALRPLLMMLADSSHNNDELHDLLDAIPERNIDAVKMLLQALADPSYNSAAGIYLPQGTAEAAGTPLAAIAGAPVVNTNAGVSNVSNGFLSIGGGAFFDWSLKNSVEVAPPNSKFRYDLMSFGPFAFFDAKYVELSVTPSFGIANYEKSGGENPESSNLKLIQLDLSALGKIPINLAGGKYIFFPMLGVSYNAVLFGISGAKGITVSNLNQFGLLGGVGLDYFITSSVFLRGEGFAHIRLPVWEYMNSIWDSGSKFGKGFRIRLGIGYRF
jgi:hypothetical protein